MKIDKATEEQHLATLRPMMTDEQPLLIHLAVRDAWMVVSAIQLASMATNIGDSQRQWMTHIARQFQGAVATRYPAVGDILEMGWHREYDVEQDT